MHKLEGQALTAQLQMMRISLRERKMGEVTGHRCRMEGCLSVITTRRLDLHLQRSHKMKPSDPDYKNLTGKDRLVKKKKIQARLFKDQKPENMV